MSRENRHITEKHLMAYLVKEADDFLVKEIEHWLSLSENNVALLNELEATWVKSGKLKIKPVVVDVDAAWNKLSGKMDAEEKKVHQPEAKRKGLSGFTKTIIRIAAVLIIAIGLWVIRNAGKKVEMQTLLSKNEVVEMDLSDGSKVSLNIDTKIIYPEEFAKNTREVELEGEAFFEVEPDEEKPFVIRSEEAYIKVLGTSFNVKAVQGEDAVVVYVESGVVMLFTVDKSVKDTISLILNTGEKGMYNRITKQIKLIEEVKVDELYWLNKTLIFEETELHTVFELLQTTYDVTIVVENSDVNDCKLNATFRNENIADILEVIAITFDLKLEKNEEQTYTLHGEGC